jgi:hypothetical protein
LGGEFPRHAVAIVLFLEWKDFPDRVRIINACSTLPQAFPYHVRAKELRSP